MASYAIKGAASTCSHAGVQVAKAGSGPASTGAAALGGDLLFEASAVSDSLLLDSPTPKATVRTPSLKAICCAVTCRCSVWLQSVIGAESRHWSVR